MSDLLQTIGRVRRAMPRNEDVMALCDALEERLKKSSKRLTRAQIQWNYRLRKKAAKT